MGLYIDVGYESLYKAGEELCGDKVELVRAPDAFYAVLADGLGSGVKANILATLTSKIIATMMAQGAKLSEVVETVANTLPVCSQRAIAYSTFTIVKIKPDGAVYAAEFDNPAFVYFRDGKMVDIQRRQSSEGGKTIYLSSFKAQPGDYLVMFSDGVVHAGVGRLLDLGWQYQNAVHYITEHMAPDISPRVLAKRVLQAVNTLYMDKAGDDSTICVLKICADRLATVMVGPPLNAENDRQVVQRLMHTPGYKVVCGGTTSQIVSRVTGQQLVVEPNYENPALPPTASISGIDLVTEGVLTLRKCLELIREQNARPAGEPTLINYNKNDGATRLAAMLLEKSTQVTFLVGRALNPAHQNPGMPVSLGLKLNLINELAAQLRLTGKKVEVEYY